MWCINTPFPFNILLTSLPHPFRSWGKGYASSYSPGSGFQLAFLLNSLPLRNCYVIREFTLLRHNRRSYTSHNHAHFVIRSTHSKTPEKLSRLWFANPTLFSNVSAATNLPTDIRFSFGRIDRTEPWEHVSELKES